VNLSVGVDLVGGDGDGCNHVSRLLAVRPSTTDADADNDWAQAHADDQAENARWTEVN
jgi:hypothetical protein